MAGTPTPPTSRGRPDPEAARALYRRHADSYDEQTDWAGPHRARVVELLDLRPGDRVVDVGCGTGLCFPAIQERCRITCDDHFQDTIVSAPDPVDSHFNSRLIAGKPLSRSGRQWRVADL